MTKQEVFPKTVVQTSWLAPPEYLRLNNNEVHLWRASLEMSPSQVKNLEHILSADELSRAGRYHFPKDRDHFIAARGLLRTILGRYLEKNPEDLRFTYGPNGKPELPGEAGGKLRFNVSHSQGLSLFAVTLNRNTGVDLEYMSSDISVGELAEQFFSPRELLEFRALHGHDRLRAFFVAWTRKEAYLKALGRGLSGDLKQLEVAPAPGCPGEFLQINCPGIKRSPCLLVDLDVLPEYAGAVVIEGRNLQFKYWQWENAGATAAFM